MGEARCRCRKVWLTRIDYYYHNESAAAGELALSRGQLDLAHDCLEMFVYRCKGFTIRVYISGGYSGGYSTLVARLLPVQMHLLLQASLR
jgi:hypothetical protein